MIVDTSAIIGILRQERDASLLSKAIEAAATRSISVVNFVEAAVVADRDGDPIMSRKLDEFCQAASLSLAPVDETQARIAREAYRDFGKGSGHPAKLNFGDCFAYALAKAKNEQLLFKGRDFSHTDVRPALPR